MAPTVDPGALLLPEGTRLVHIGPHKTGTTALQAALFAARPALLAHGVRHAGTGRNPAGAVRAVTGRRSPYADAEGSPAWLWRELAHEVANAAEPRVVVSSEFFAWATPDVVRRVVDDLGGEQVHVAVTLRPLARILPSQWQQNVQNGAVIRYEAWLDQLLREGAGKAAADFWQLHRHDELVARWADVVGRDRVTVVVLDERDHGMVLRVFEGLLGVGEGTLVAVPDLANRSLTRAEAEAVRAFNVAYKAEGLGRALYTRVIRNGAALHLKQREPGPDEPRVETPQWALDRAVEIDREIVDAIAASGVRVVGDLESLAAPQASRPAGERAPDDAAWPAVAGSLGMGVLVASGAARGAAAAPRWLAFTEPAEMARIPTRLVFGVLVLRGWGALARRWAAVRRRLPGRRAGS